MKDYRLGTVLRKWTTPVHWAFGVLCGAIAIQFFPAGLALLAISAGNQIWNDYEEKFHKPNYLPTGCADWWEGFLTFCITMTVAVILSWCKVLTINYI